LKVLVTGPDGLLGSNLVRELMARGFSVRVLVQPGSKSPTLDGLDIQKVRCDLLAGRDGLADAMAGCDAVFHLAAITDQWADPSLTWKVNLDGTRNVLRGCVAAGVKRLVYVGSASSFQFGAIDRPGDESGSFPEEYRGEAYAESKTRARDLVLEWVSERRIDATVVAPTFMLGPFDSRPSSGELIRQFIVRGFRFTSPGGRNFAYVGDVAHGAASALERGRTGECYILGGRNMTYLDFFTRVAQIASVKPPRVVLPGPLLLAGGAAGSVYEAVSGGKVMINYRLAKLALLGTYYTSAKAIKELGLPQTPVERAIRESIECLREYGHLKEAG